MLDILETCVNHNLNNDAGFRMNIIKLVAKIALYP
jgi:hypothetical protein